MSLIINKCGLKVNSDRCDYKELNEEGSYDKGFILNPSNCECECDKSCDVAESLDYESCKCREKLVDKLVEGCSEKIDEFKIAKIVQQNYENEFKSFCTVYIVLFSVFWTISIGIGTVFIYFY